MAGKEINKDNQILQSYYIVLVNTLYSEREGNSKYLLKAIYNHINQFLLKQLHNGQYDETNPSEFLKMISGDMKLFCPLINSWKSNYSNEALSLQVDVTECVAHSKIKTACEFSKKLMEDFFGSHYPGYIMEIDITNDNEYACKINLCLNKLLNISVL